MYTVSNEVDRDSEVQREEEARSVEKALKIVHCGFVYFVQFRRLNV